MGAAFYSSTGARGGLTQDAAEWVATQLGEVEPWCPLDRSRVSCLQLVTLRPWRRTGAG